MLILRLSLKSSCQTWQDLNQVYRLKIDNNKKQVTQVVHQTNWNRMHNINKRSANTRKVQQGYVWLPLQPQSSFTVSSSTSPTVISDQQNYVTHLKQQHNNRSLNLHGRGPISTSEITTVTADIRRQLCKDYILRCTTARCTAYKWSLIQLKHTTLVNVSTSQWWLCLPYLCQVQLAPSGKWGMNCRSFSSRCLAVFAHRLQ